MLFLSVVAAISVIIYYVRPIILLGRASLEVQSEVRAAVQPVGPVHMGDVARGVLG